MLIVKFQMEGKNTYFLEITYDNLCTIYPQCAFGNKGQKKEDDKFVILFNQLRVNK